MAIKIDEDMMTLEIGGVVIATARQRPDGWWEVSHWPRFFDRNQAITALTVTELLETGYRSDHPVVTALREELR
jgi:hypothetical protein